MTTASRSSDRTVLELLDERGPLTRQQIAAGTGLAARTVSAVAGRLIARDLVEKFDSTDAWDERGSTDPEPVQDPRPSTASPGEMPRGAGRPPRLLRRQPHSLHAVVLVSHREVRFGVSRSDGVTVVPLQHRPFRWPDREDLPADVAEIVRSTVSTAGLDPTSVRHVVVGLPMPYRPGGGITFLQADSPSPPMRAPSQYPAWVHTDVAAACRRHLDAVVLVENDVNLAALGEATVGAAASADSMVFLKVGAVLAAGIVLDGRLVRGTVGAAGELGHLRVDPDGPPCFCGSRGCLGMIADVSHLAAALAETHGDGLPLLDMLGLAVQSDPRAGRRLTELGRAVGTALAPAMIVLNPRSVIVDSALGPAAVPIMKGLHAAFDASMPRSICASLNVAAGTLGDTADVHGAAALVRHAITATATS